MSRIEIMRGLQCIGFRDVEVIRLQLDEIVHMNENDRATFARGVSRSLFAPLVHVLSREILANGVEVILTR